MPELTAADVIGTEFGDEAGSSLIIFCVLPVQRLLPPGERPVKPVPPFSGASSLAISAAPS